MKKLLGGLFAAGLSMSLVSTAAAQSLEASVQNDMAFLEDLYLYFHQNPELSFLEKESSKRVADELEAVGYEVTRNFGGYGVVAVLRNGDGPTIMLRGDMDALPVKELTGLPYASTVVVEDHEGQEVPVMHACGHDVHMTVLVGAGRQMAAMKDQWSGTLVLIGQPAEERGGGAIAMLEEGLFEKFPKPDVNLAIHTSPAIAAGDVGYVEGWALANVDSVDILVRGIGGHGAYPHLTKDPIVLSAEIINNLQTLVSRVVSPLETAVLTVGSIHGGFKHNIISDEVRMQLTVRSYSDETRQQLLQGIERISVNMGRAAGLPEDLLPVVTIAEGEYTPATYNNPELTRYLVGVLQNVEGVENVVPAQRVMAGEDFSRFGRTDDNIPSAIFWLGGVERAKLEASQRGEISLPGLHSPLFAPDYAPTVRTGVNALSSMAIDLFNRGN